MTSKDLQNALVLFIISCDASEPTPLGPALVALQGAGLPQLTGYDFEEIVGICVHSSLVSRKGHTALLTGKGVALQSKIQATIAESKAATK